MGPLVYLDQNVFSNMLTSRGKDLHEVFAAVGLTIAFSGTHLREMRGKPEEYGELLDQIGAVFVHPPNKRTPLAARHLLIEDGRARERFSEDREFLDVFAAEDSSLASLHHFMGGRREFSSEEIAAEVQARLEAIILEPLRDLLSDDDEARTLYGAKLNQLEQRLREVTELRAGTSTDGGWEFMDRQFSQARQGDRMRGMTPLAKVRFVMGLLPDPDRSQFESLFPLDFGKDGAFEEGRLAGFATALFGMGLVKRKGEFTGRQQERNFLAQVMDTRHIEAAATCELFCTFDKEAATLAKATYAYAGLNTEVLCMAFT